MHQTKHRALWSALVATAILMTPWAASAALKQPSSVGVKFVAVGPAGMNIVGQSAQLQIHDDGQIMQFIAPLTSLKTGIELRDRHMKEKYLEVEKYPNAMLRVDRKQLGLPSSAAKLSGDARGTLTLHGRDKLVPFHYVAARDGSGYAVSATFRVNFKEFGIEVPSYLGVTVKPDVDVSVQFHAQDN